MKNRKLAFYEISRGKFAQEAQRNFERAQTMAIASSMPVKIKMEITVNPPLPADPNYTTVHFKNQFIEPAFKSIPQDVVMIDGLIVSDSELPAEQLSLLDLEIDEDKDKDGTLNFPHTQHN